MTGPTGDWMHELDLPFDIESPRAARRWTSGHLAGEDPEWVGLVEVLVSELVTNGVVHGAGEAGLSVKAVRRGDHLHVRVHNHTDGDGPQTRPADEDDENGRGLLLLSTLARYGSLTYNGEVWAWFEIPFPKPLPAPWWQTP